MCVILVKRNKGFTQRQGDFTGNQDEVQQSGGAHKPHDIQQDEDWAYGSLLQGRRTKLASVFIL